MTETARSCPTVTSDRDARRLRMMQSMVVCAVCGKAVSAQDVPLTWTTQASACGQQWLCETCTRENLRSIEGRLDGAWW